MCFLGVKGSEYQVIINDSGNSLIVPPISFFGLSLWKQGQRIRFQGFLVGGSKHLHPNFILFPFALISLGWVNSSRLENFGEYCAKCEIRVKSSAHLQSHFNPLFKISQIWGNPNCGLISDISASSSRLRLSAACVVYQYQGKVWNRKWEWK